MMIAPGIELPDDVFREFCRRHHIKELMLFGSAARGEMRPESDIDLLVDYAPEFGADLFEHLIAQRDLEELLGRKVDLVSKRALRDRMRRIVMADARPLYAA